MVKRRGSRCYERAKEFRDRGRAEFLADLPNLDLHGLNPVDAVDPLNGPIYGFLQEQKDRGEIKVKIIYGKGKGKLKKAVLEFLKSEYCLPLIDHIREADGHCVVFLD